jgi:GntR family transcriptional regulator
VNLKTNPNTIAKAYGELEIRRVLVTLIGCGTFISDKAPLLKKELNAEEGLNRRIQAVLGRFVQDMRDLGVEGEDLVRAVKNYENGKQETASPGIKASARRKA